MNCGPGGRRPEIGTSCAETPDRGGLRKDATARNSTIDALRVLAAFGVVVFHAHLEDRTFREISYAGLICFIIISTVFALSAPISGAPRMGLLRRLSIPWVVWSLLFLCVDVYHDDLPDSGEEWLLLPLAGTAIHLWYLPFIAATSLLLSWIRRRASFHAIETLGYIGLIGLTATAHIWRPWSLEQAAPFPQYVHALFPIFAGVMIYCDLQRQTVFRSILVVACALVMEPYYGLSIPYVVGTVLCFLAFRYSGVPIFERDKLRQLADCMFGVYLVHPLLFGLVRSVINKDNLLYPALTFLLATVLVVLVRSLGAEPLLLIFGISGRASPRSQAESGG